MNIQKYKLVLSLIIAAGLVACASQEQKLTETGAIRLNKEAVLLHLVGNTEKWSNGSGYYMPEGQMEAVWKGTKTQRTYSVTDTGKVCIKGEQTFCHFYMNDNGAIVMFVDGKNKGEKSMLRGNQTSNL